MMWYWGNGVQWWGWLLMSIAMVAFWGVIVWAIWYLVSSIGRSPESPRPTEPKRILDERLARGEIDADEYARLRDVMERGDAPTTNGRTHVGTGSPR